MKILVIGGTRFFGIHMVNKLLELGHSVTIATRGNAKDNFGDRVSRIILERTNQASMKQNLEDKEFDVAIDNLAYCSNDVKYALETIRCKKYIMMSSTAVYEKHINTIEEDFNPLNKELIWCSRMDFSYEEIKRQAECALFQEYKNITSIAVRYPFVIGQDDYTKRLLFYVRNVIKEIPMFINNYDKQMSFLRSDEAGEFLAYLIDKNFVGSINGSSSGTISIKEIIEYVENKVGKVVILSEDGEKAPYNDEVEYSINTDKAMQLGYKFSHLKDWIYSLVDYYIEQVMKEH